MQQAFKLLGLPSGRVKSCQSLSEMIPTNILKHYTVDKQGFPYKRMVHISWVGLTKWISQSYHQDIKNHSTHSWKIETTHAGQKGQSDINIDSWGFDFSQSLCTPKFIGMLSDKNNQGLNQNVQFLFYLFIV
jgi:hypothetical protein